MLEYEVLDACLKLLRDMFMLKPGETIAITTDTMSSDEIVEATAQAAVILGASHLSLRSLHRKVQKLAIKICR